MTIFIQRTTEFQMTLPDELYSDETSIRLAKQEADRHSSVTNEEVTLVMGPHQQIEEVQ